MKIIRKFQYFDLTAQSLFLAGFSIPAVPAMIYDPGFLIWSLFFLFPLGAWQLFSALILGFALDDIYRRIYLITAIAFSSLFFTTGALLDHAGQRINFEIDQIAFFVAIFISFVAAIVYYIYSFRYFRTEGNQDLL